jgi:hypothetical protein
MRRIALASVSALVLAGLCAVPALAGDSPDPAEFTPKGYNFCGWKDIGGSGDWKMEWDDSLAGAYLVGFAHGMSCRNARRNITRVRYTQTPPYRPMRPGYRCTALDNDYEYSDVRCTKVGGSRKFRFRTGA